jgi:hypothetical protein
MHCHTALQHRIKDQGPSAAARQAKLLLIMSSNSCAPVNFTRISISWTNGVSAPCHFQLASILCFRPFYEIFPIFPFRTPVCAFGV